MTPTSSVAAVQLSATEVAEAARAVSPLGAVGAVVSGQGCAGLPMLGEPSVAGLVANVLPQYDDPAVDSSLWIAAPAAAPKLLFCTELPPRS